MLRDNIVLLQNNNRSTNNIQVRNLRLQQLHGRNIKLNQEMESNAWVEDTNIAIPPALLSQEMEQILKCL